MSSPSSLMLPDTRQMSTVSFMRLRQRRKVDLPQPEGPIIARTSLLPMSRLTCSIPILSPYITPTFREVMRGFSTVTSPTVSMSSGTGSVSEGGSVVGSGGGVEVVICSAVTLISGSWSSCVGPVGRSRDPTDDGFELVRACPATSGARTAGAG